MKAFTHEEKKLIVMAANELAQKNAGAVYLVGSCMTGTGNLNGETDPLDVDIVLVVTDVRFTRLFGGTPGQVKMAWSNAELGYAYVRSVRYCLKQKMYFESFLTEREVDFKVQTVKEFNERKGPRKRLDLFKNILLTEVENGESEN